MSHPNSQKRFYGDYIYFITCNVEDKLEIFRNEQFCEFWIEELRLCKELKDFKLYAFCMNYDHFHILLKPNNQVANYSQIMQFLKRNFSQNINKILGFNPINTENDIMLTEGDIAQCRLQMNFVTESDVGQRRLRQKNNKTQRRLRQKNNESQRRHRKREQPKEWQIEMDNFVIKMKNRYDKKYPGHHSPFQKFKWQKSFHDHIIRNEKDYQFHWNYTMHNYRKHGLPENWEFTGLKYPDLIDDIYQEII